MTLGREGRETVIIPGYQLTSLAWLLFVMLVFGLLVRKFSVFVNRKLSLFAQELATCPYSHPIFI